MPIARWFASVRNPRALALACIACSALLALNDISSRLDLQLELASRFCMLVVAAFAVRATAGDPCARLLVWGLIGASLDLFWQTNTDPGPEQWAAMIVKYVGLGGGLIALLRLTATFGDGPGRRRRWIARAAPWLGLALVLAGLLHGTLWITQCQTDCAPADRPLDALALASYDAYLFLDASIRALMIAAAVFGLAHASASERPRLQLVTVACVLFAAGTLLDFTARLVHLDALVPALWRDTFDALATLAFPIVLGIAIVMRRLFDVEYVLRRALVGSVVLALLATAFIVSEQYVHYRLATWLFGNVVVPMLGRERAEALNLEMIVDVVMGIACLLAFKPLEEFGTESVSHAIAPERERRLEVLETFAERLPEISDGDLLERRLVHTLQRGTDALFTDVYVRDGSGGYAPTPSSHAAAPPIGANAATELARGKPIAGARANALVTTSELLLPMLVGGKLFGVIVCGPKRSEVSYAPDEVKQLCTIAREAGASLFALRAAA